MSRILPQSAYLSLKAATRRLIGMAGGVEHAETRVGKSMLSDYGNPFRLDYFAPLDVIADLEASVGEPIVSVVLAQLVEDGKRPAKDESCNPVHLSAEVMVALGRMGLDVRRGHVYSSVGGKKVLTNRPIEYANMMLQERQTVRVRQEPEGMRA